MRACLAVFRRELAEYRLVFPAALLIGLVALAAPWLPGAGGHPPAEVRGAAALSLGLVVTYVLAAVLGATVIVRDLAERRLGFYFARPLPGWALWAGKLAAAAVLALAAGALVLLPSLVAGGTLDPGGSWWLGGLQPRDVAELVLFLALGSLTLLLAAHVLGTMVRARSPWLLLDLLTALAVAAAFAACQGALLDEGAVGAFARGASLFLAGALVSAAAASAVQVARGRTDLRRAHRLLSLTLWSCLAGTSAAFAGYTAWILRVEPEDLTEIHGVVPAPAGTWVGLDGTARGRADYLPSFLLDLESGRALKIRSGSQILWPQPLFSADGGRAVWVDPRGFAVTSLDLARPGARPVRSAISYQAPPLRLALSPDGTRIAALHKDRLTVDDFARGRLLASVPMSYDYQDRLRFVDDRRLRIYQASHKGILKTERWRLDVRELDLATRRISEVARLTDSGNRTWSVSPDGERILLEGEGPEVRLVDLLSGRTLASLVPDARTLSTGLLADGAAAVLARDRGRDGFTFTALDRNGSVLSRVRLPGVHARFGAQPLPGHQVVATSRPGPPGSRVWESWLVELATGRVRRLGGGLVPMAARAVGPESAASRLFGTGGGGLVLLDPVTGRRRTVLEPGS